LLRTTAKQPPGHWEKIKTKNRISLSIAYLKAGVLSRPETMGLDVRLMLDFAREDVIALPTVVGFVVSLQV
jgi:hypothetical protein